MRFRLLRRRLTISAPRMAIRSHTPWPVRWALAALMLGFSAALGLWAFEKGKELAGVDSRSKEELAQLRVDVARLQAEREQVQSVVNTSGSLIAAEKAAQERLTAQVKILESENRALRDDLGFYERLLPASSTDGATIRGFQVEPSAPNQLKWQVLVIQPNKNAPDFNGRLELTFVGVSSGKPWTASLPQAQQILQFKQSRRVEGLFDLPEQTVVKTVTVKLMEGGTVRAVQTIKL